MGEKLTISTFLCKFPILLKLCLQLNPYLPNFWRLSFPEDSDSGSYLCVFLYFKTHYHTNRRQKPTVLDLTFSDLISKDILPYFNALSTPKTIPWSLSTALIHKFTLYCKLLILWAYSLIYSHYTFLMSTLESQVQWSITFSLSISISPIFTFLPIQVISGGPKFQTISCYILNSSCLTVL